MEKITLQADSVAKPMGPYSQGIKTHGGALLCISGQVPENAQGDLVGAGDFRVQAVQVMENLKAMVEAGGGTLGDIVKLTIFLTDIRNYKVVSEVRAQYFEGVYPASTLVEVSRLVQPEWMLEIEAIAMVER